MLVYKKIKIMISLLMALTLSVFYSAIILKFTGYFRVSAWVISLIVGLLVTFILGFLIPIESITDNVCFKLDMNKDKIQSKLLCALVSDLVYTPVITIIMSVIMVLGITSSMDKQLELKEQEIQTTQATISSMINEADTLKLKMDKAINEDTKDKISSGITVIDGQLLVMKDKVKLLNESIDSLVEQKPKMKRVLLWSVLFNFIAAYILILLLYPIYLNNIMKKFNLLY